MPEPKSWIVCALFALLMGCDASDPASVGFSSEIREIKQLSDTVTECVEPAGSTCLATNSYIWSDDREGVVVATLLINGTKVTVHSDFAAHQEMICEDNETAEYYWNDQLLGASSRPTIELLDRILKKLGRFVCTTYSSTGPATFSTFTTAGDDVGSQRPMEQPIGSSVFTDTTNMELRELTDL